MEKLKPAEAVVILREQGLEVTEEEAGLILDFVYAMAEIAVAQYLREENNQLSKAG